MFKIIFFLLGLLVILGTFFTLLRSTIWWVRIFDFPRIQLTFIAFCSLFYFIGFGHYYELYEKAFLGLLSISFVYQLIQVFPYTPIALKQVKKSSYSGQKENNICILISNIFMDNKESSLFKAVLKKADPDLILVLEANEWWKQQLEVLEKKYPYQKHYPLENTYGLLFYSKLKLIDTKIKFRLEKDIPSIETLVELPSGRHIKFFGVHPKPPSPQESLNTTERDAELILVGKEAKKCHLPVIVAGDLNDVAWSHTTRLFQRISGLLDPRIGRGMYSTFNAHYPLLRWPLDHVFHSADFKLESLHRLNSVNSDHFPICIKLKLEPYAGKDQEEPLADAEDEKEAKERVEEAEELKE